MGLFKDSEGEAKPTGVDLSSVGSLAGQGIGALTDNSNPYSIVNAAGATHSSQLGYGEGTQSAAFAAKEGEIDAKHKAVGAGLTSAAAATAMIPGVGWIASGVLGLAGGLTSAGVFKSKKKEEQRAEEDRSDMDRQYSAMRGNEATADSQKALRESTYARGGYTDDYLNLFGMENDFSYGGVAKPGGYEGVPTFSDNNNGPLEQDTDTQSIYKVQNGGTHEEDPNGGTTISLDSDGTPNKAEEGEVVVELPSGQFVFSNRF